jgi:hypothetical protein
MNHGLFLFLSVLTMPLVGCHATPMTQPSASVPVTRMFGPVIAQQVIRGREEEDDEVLLLVDSTILRIDLKGRGVSVAPIDVAPGETCWGLGRLTDGSLWTMRGRNAIVRVEANGRISRVMPLDEPHAGLFASGDRLIYQKAVSSAPDYALRGRVPGGSETTWSEMRVRSFPAIARAQASVLSLVSCGRSLVAERACWFPDEAAVSLVDRDGATRRVVLIGLTPVAPELLLTAENPRRPVRDAYIDEQSRIWILSSGEAPPDAPKLPGGWVLARYSREGTPEGHVQLAEPVRLILRVDDRRVIVLAGSGYVSEVATW